MTQASYFSSLGTNSGTITKRNALDTPPWLLYFFRTVRKRCESTPRSFIIFLHEQRNNRSAIIDCTSSKIL